MRIQCCFSNNLPQDFSTFRTNSKFWSGVPFPLTIYELFYMAYSYDILFSSFIFRNWFFRGKEIAIIINQTLSRLCLLCQHRGLYNWTDKTITTDKSKLSLDFMHTVFFTAGSMLQLSSATNMHEVSWNGALMKCILVKK